MADGTISIKVEIDGKQINIATDNLKDLESAGKQAGDGLKNTEQGSKKAGSSVKDFAVSLGLVKIGAAAFNVLRKSLDSAISRFDTLNTFPKVLQALGVSAEQSEKAMSDLSDGIDGLPTKLDDIAATAQRMYNSFQDIDKATDSALALNNALLASGADANEAQRGTDQYIKALQTGKMELDTWTSLQTTMGLGLTKVSEAFNMTEQEMYQALKSGQVSMNDFNDKMIELGTGTGIMAELAKENSLGLATSMQNLGTAVARNVANMITKFDKLAREVTGKNIAENIDSLKVVVNSAFNVIGSAIEKATPFVKGFASAVEFALPVIKALTPALIGLASAYAIHAVLGKTIAALQASKAITTAVTVAKRLYTLAVLEAGSGLVTTMAIEKAHAIALASKTAILKLSALAYGVMTGAISISTAVQVVATAASYALGAAIQFLLGPVGWVTAGIGLLIGVVGGLVKIFTRTSAEAKRLNDETEALSESTDALNDSIDGTSSAYEDTQKSIKSTANANENLAKNIDELSRKENKSVADKAMLAQYIDQLNGRVDGLSLAYDEEADSLNMSSKELQARLDLMKETEAGLAAQERLTEIVEEQTEAQLKLDEINELRKEWNDKLKENSVTAGEAEKAIAGLDEKEAELKETLALLAEQYGITEEQIITATENATAAVEEGNLRQITSYDDLKDHQKEAFDSMKEAYDQLVDNATNAFDRMNDESKVTAEEMIANLEHNQEMTAKWGENIAELYERAGKESIDDGFIKYLENLGPDAAAEVQEVTNMSDAELKRYSELMAEGGEVASTSLKTALGEGFEDAVDVMINFVDDGSQTLREQVKNSDFEDIGSMIPEGLIDGVEGGIPDAEDASKDMADAVIKGAQEQLSIHSPSRVFKEIGSNTTQGMTLGINAGIPKIVSASKKAINDMVKPYNDTPQFFRSIGINAMNGLNAGLNAGRNRVMATARNIANQVASTMRGALRIHSPSRVMEDIGEFTGEGFVNGLLAMESSAKSAAKAISEAVMFNTPNASSSMASPTVKSSYKTKMNAKKIMEIFNKFVEV